MIRDDVDEIFDLEVDEVHCKRQIVEEPKGSAAVCELGPHDRLGGMEVSARPISALSN
jgi:hypothetical protein